MGPLAPLLNHLSGVDLKHLSLKAVLLLPVAYAKQVSNIHALLVHPSCTQFALGHVRALIKPNLASVPKVVGSCSPSDLMVSLSSPFSSSEEQWFPAYLYGQDLAVSEK